MSCCAAPTQTDAAAAATVERVRAQVSEYYGRDLGGTSDLKTDACLTANSPSPAIRAVLALLHEDVLSKYYGCGLPLPAELEGQSVLDLGCGAGRDCYILSKLVGPYGRVVGVDMTAEQLAVARAHQDFHTKQFGYEHSNVEFKQGVIEDLAAASVASGSVDIVVSNCVINLCPNKRTVLQEVHRVLRNGGELYFSDVYCDRRIPDHLQADRVLWGECLSGALYLGDFLALAKSVGFADPRLVEQSPINVGAPALVAQLRGFRFFSATYRLFKLPQLEPACEDYGEAVRYRGSLPESPQEFVLDEAHTFTAHRMALVCGNTFDMLKHTRFAKHFEFFSTDRAANHFGLFAACSSGTAVVAPQQPSQPSAVKGGCC